MQKSKSMHRQAELKTQLKEVQGQLADEQRRRTIQQQADDQKVGWGLVACDLAKLYEVVLCEAVLVRV